MSKELIERLKWRIQIRNAMNADRTDPITKDMQESVTAIEALLAERDALAAELKEVREQVPVGVVDESDDGVFADLETTNGVLVKLGDKLYAHPVPARKLTDAVDDLAQHIRQINGNHSMGAGALAESIAEWADRHLKGEGNV